MIKTEKNTLPSKNFNNSILNKVNFPMQILIVSIDCTEYGEHIIQEFQ